MAAAGQQQSPELLAESKHYHPFAPVCCQGIALENKMQQIGLPLAL